MARVPQSKEIKGASERSVTYVVQLLPPTQALDLLIDIAKMVGPGLAPVFANLGTLKGMLDQDVASLDTSFLGTAVERLLLGADKAMTKDVIKRLAVVTSIDVDGKQSKLESPALFEMHFAQEGLGAMFAWVAFALQTQYTDFLDALRNVIGGAPFLSKTVPTNAA